MTSVVLDASAILALIRDEPGATEVAESVGRAAVSAVNLHEVVKELLVSGLAVPAIRELLSELRLDVRAHNIEAAYRAAALYPQTKAFGRGIGDRSCMALAIELNVPALTADNEWRKMEIEGLQVKQIR